MAELLNRVRAVMRSLGNDGALANVQLEMAAAAQARLAVDQLALRLAPAPEPAETTSTPRAA